ncbi:GM11409 [Drosophila sechellia]|uniref:GM11409 n=1 Tax=Drosophila sechellia TaxID=7238 RepID=B4IDM4_DROSE|nr:GM11409 [Drosophila sechellia]
MQSQSARRERATPTDVNVNESPVHLTICDTAGQDTLDPLRELCYPDSDVFLLCFSVVKPETFRAIKAKWAPKFAKTKAALILVGTQADLRTSPNVLNKLQTNGEEAISYADAWDLATTIGAKYIETSSATQVSWLDSKQPKENAENRNEIYHKKRKYDKMRNAKSTSY